MSKRENYEVGYKKPPRQHQFQPGQSGNRKGRPKGAISLEEAVRKALRTKIIITEGGKRRAIDVISAAIKRLIEQAVAKGDLRAIGKLLALAEAHGERPHVAESTSAEERAIIDAAFARLTRAKSDLEE